MGVTTMTFEAFKAIKIGDKIATRFGARTRKVTFVYDDPTGARIVNLSAINGCTASITNMDSTGPNDFHYSGSVTR
jgi:hypothetical protein